MISDPSALLPERIRELTKAFIEISVQATAGDDWKSYQPGREGWAHYYESPGGRPQDCSRVVLVHCNDQVVHFTALDP